MPDRFMGAAGCQSLLAATSPNLDTSTWAGSETCCGATLAGLLAIVAAATVRGNFVPVMPFRTLRVQGPK